ncbi:MAG: DNA double-strand break repair nuclease NurA [Candidatus Micrarchaeota archaeon]|nr:DNA double-strand break repair nuclease NurA [Candidatus Micrarchaeota archaeon]
MPLEQQLEQIAQKIFEEEAQRKELASRLRFNSGKISYPETLEQELCIKVEKSEVNGRIAAVDAGVVGQEFHGFDFLALRVAGAVFEYRQSKVVSHLYFPSASPPISYDVRGGLESYEITWHKSLFRLKGELDAARELIEKHKPDYLFLDGSIAPLLSDKPSEDSAMRCLYDSVVASYCELYQVAQEKNCALVGVIKDSRSRRFIEILQKHSANEGGFLRTTDTSFLSYLLSEGERTCAFSYSSAPKKHQILKDLGGWSDKIASFYLKAVRGDRPLRVEFLSGQRTFSQTASLVFSLSSIHKSYAYPAILIEADLRAALSEQDFERAYHRLYARVGFSGLLAPLRRDSRPFR